MSSLVEAALNTSRALVMHNIFETERLIRVLNDIDSRF